MSGSRQLRRRTARTWVGRPASADPSLFVRFGRVTRNAFPIASVALALLVTQGVRPLHHQPPVLLFFVAVVTTSWYAGLTSGFIASMLSMLVLDHFFIGPFSTLRVELLEDGADVVAFAAATWLVSTLQYRWRESHHKVVTIERELGIARQIQQRMLPAHPPVIPGFELGGACFPADATGGDFFDYIPMPEGRVAIVCGDVSGHGIGPALLMASVHSCLRVGTYVRPSGRCPHQSERVHLR